MAERFSSGYCPADGRAFFLGAIAPADGRAFFIEAIARQMAERFSSGR
jgi:hypothetical protein